MAEEYPVISRRTALVAGLGAGAVVAAGGRAGAGPADAALIAARSRFFGAENVDQASGVTRPDRVIVSWFGCTSFAVSLGGTVVLLDAWVPRGASSGYVPTSREQVAALRPVAVLIGHGHFDHAADAGFLARESGATVYGTAEHCRAIRAQVADSEIACAELGSARSPIGESYERNLDGTVSMTVVRHLHSTMTAPDRSPAGSAPFFPIPDPSGIARHPPTPADLCDTVAHLGDEEGGSLLYQLRIRDFVLTWHDTSGPLADRAPHVLEGLAALPPTDLHLGAIQGFNQLTNGLRDPRTYIEALRPRIFAPSHHDNWLPLLTAPGDRYTAALSAELDRIPAVDRPELIMLRDPDNYLNPARLTFPI